MQAELDLGTPFLAQTRNRGHSYRSGRYLTSQAINH